MRIHVVTRDHTSDQVLARLAAQLVEHSAFTVGEAPDPQADLNLFAPYLEWDRFRSFKETKIAAWFSHRDDGRTSKTNIWKECAKAVDLRLVWTSLYQSELEKYGPTSRVIPPLDRGFFALKKQTKHERLVIGTSGFVYPGGRKGESLFAQLVTDFSGQDFKASGQGWIGVKSELLSWDEVPSFYQSLDIYVCTSLIEGIGYGPLEAMSCGIPVVIPQKVGVFDELPDLENVYRYKAGDYSSLKTAVGLALKKWEDGGYNPTSLRSAVTRYSNEAWQESHVEAFERLLYDVKRERPEHPWHGKSGVYYVAYGEPARECAVRAITSFKKYMPDIPIAFVSDKPLNAGEDIFIEHEDLDIGGRSVKTQIYDLAPKEWEYVLYLDADTEVVSDISFLFQILEDGWNMAICINPAQYVLAREMIRPDNLKECTETFAIMGSDELIQANGGVFSFRRSEQTENFFHNWHEEWDRYGARDQAALDRVLYTNPIRIYLLGNEWNTITRYLDASTTAGILHYPTTARRWGGRVNGRLDGSEAWAMVHPGGKQK